MIELIVIGVTSVFSHQDQASCAGDCDSNAI
jgi:hypothetical protein